VGTRAKASKANRATAPAKAAIWRRDQRGPGRDELSAIIMIGATAA
jgi:hypothetical protein